MLRRSPVLLLAIWMISTMVFFSMIGCTKTDSGNRTQAGQSQATPKRITAADLKNLRWIEGAWRGTGDIDKPFFERYHFENDTTLIVETFPDETLNRVDSVSRYELKDEQFVHMGNEARWVATQFDANSITFEPIGRARNTFRWEKQTELNWKAVLVLPASENSAAKQTVYQMDRLVATK